jgi:hypothetical protein
MDRLTRLLRKDEKPQRGKKSKNRRELLVLGLTALGLLWGAMGCGAWKYKPPIPTDYVSWRYSQHNYLRKSWSRSSHRSGNYVVTVTTHSRRYKGRRVLRIPDHLPPIRTANAHILKRYPSLLKEEFRAPDGTTAAPLETREVPETRTNPGVSFLEARSGR